MIAKAKGYCSMIHVIFVIFLSTLLISCEPRIVSEYGDGGLISEKPCSAPCFLGILPGETSKGQAIDTIKKQGFIEYHEAGRSISFSNLIYFEYDSNEYISSIQFAPTVNISIRNVVDKYGEPSRVSVRYDPSSIPEHNYFDMAIYYDKIFTYLILPNQENWPAYEISPNTWIEKVIYFDETDYKNAVSIDRHITEWKGFVSYQDPVPP